MVTGVIPLVSTGLYTINLQMSSVRFRADLGANRFYSFNRRMGYTNLSTGLLNERNASRRWLLARRARRMGLPLPSIPNVPL